MSLVALDKHHPLLLALCFDVIFFFFFSKRFFLTFLANQTKGGCVFGVDRRLYIIVCSLCFQCAVHSCGRPIPGFLLRRCQTRGQWDPGYREGRRWVAGVSDGGQEFDRWWSSARHQY